MPEEERLSGGNVAESLFRVGSTVRKPATVATPAVQALLGHLHAVGFVGAPQSFGFDELGRQVLEFLPGAMWDRERRNAAVDLRRVGALIRLLHDATASFTPCLPAQWDALSRANGQDILCHNDLAPWNLVCGAERWAFIDWDNAAPGTRLWDLSWATLTFPPVESDGDLPMAAAAIHEIVAGYRLQPSEYGALLHLMGIRAQATSDLLTEGARTGKQPWARLHAEGHDKHWGQVSRYVSRNIPILERMLISLSGG